MAKRHAKPLTDSQLDNLMARLPEMSQDPLEDRVVFLLSFKGALRAQEMAGLRWKENLFDAAGDWNTRKVEVKQGRRTVKTETLMIFVGGDIAKGRAYGQERTIPAHPLLFEALKTLRLRGNTSPYVLPSRKSGSSQDVRKRAHALATRINRLYRDFGLDATSHSGRRTRLTQMALMAQESNHHTLKDVQLLAGHKRLTTTETYIGLSPHSASLMLMD